LAKSGDYGNHEEECGICRRRVVKGLFVRKWVEAHGGAAKWGAAASPPRLDSTLAQA
jgi:hypothetical protein